MQDMDAETAVISCWYGFHFNMIDSKVQKICNYVEVEFIFLFIWQWIFLRITISGNKQKIVFFATCLYSHTFETFQTVQLLGNSYKEMAVDGEAVSAIWKVNFEISSKV